MGAEKHSDRRAELISWNDLSSRYTSLTLVHSGACHLRNSRDRGGDSRLSAMETQNRLKAEQMNTITRWPVTTNALFTWVKRRISVNRRTTPLVRIASVSLLA